MIAGTKFGRNYSLQIQVSDDPTDLLTITLPFTIDFTIQRDILSSVNNATIRLYNLSLNHRNQIRKDYIATSTLRTVTLSAGYNGQQTVVFYGNIIRGSSTREGVDFITQIEAQDWSFVFSSIGSDSQQTQSFGPYAPGTTYRQVFTDMIKKGFQGHVSLGAIGAGYDVPIGRNTPFDGAVADQLTTLTKGAFYIDSGVAYILGQAEMLNPQSVSLINADTGLLGTPILENNVLHFDILFEPGLIAGQKLTLVSTTDPGRDGDYKVVSIAHKCMISESVCGDAITTVGLFNTKFYNGTTVANIGSN